MPVVGGLLILVLGGLAVGVGFAGGADRAKVSAAAGAYPTSLTTVTRRTLSSQVQVPATLGYAGTYSVVNQARGVLTALPAAGTVVAQGHPLYAVNAAPILLLYGSTPAYRGLSDGMSGADVQELNADLVALGNAARGKLNPRSNTFGPVTTAAVRKLQARFGLVQTGSLALGQVVFLPSAVRVTATRGTPGGPVMPGMPILQATSTTRQVIVALDASLQSEVRVGDQVTITLPDSSTTTGRVSSVGTVATAPPSDSSGGSSGTSTIPVDIALSHPSAAGHLDQAPVQVSIISATVKHALAVPVDALLATASGGYTVEVVGRGGVHRLVSVRLGLFDDADGLVQVTGSGLRAGERIVVPST